MNRLTHTGRLKAVGGRPKVEPAAQQRRNGAAAPTAYSLQPTAFTLVELLVTVSIIAILASLFLGGLYSAQDQARAIKTKSTIAKLDTIIKARWESYKTRRVPITIPAGTQPNIAAAMRLTALREIMRLELPNLDADIPDLSITSSTYSIGGNNVIIPRPSVSYSYKRRWGTPATTDTLHGAECLYLIVTLSATDDEAGREVFGESEVGDTDKDGRMEFLDAWGNPITFVRWPAGFASELQPVYPPNGEPDPKKNPDPFDSRRVHPESYALYPLIYSAGPDGEYRIRVGQPPTTTATATTSGIPGILDTIGANGFQFRAGGVTDENSNGTIEANEVTPTLDNIHNHLMGTR